MFFGDLGGALLDSGPKHRVHRCSGVTNTHFLHNPSLPLAEGRVPPQFVVYEFHLDFYSSSGFLAGFGPWNPWVTPTQPPGRGCWLIPDLPLTSLPFHTPPVPACGDRIFVIPAIGVLVGSAVNHLCIVLPVVELAVCLGGCRGSRGNRVYSVTRSPACASRAHVRADPRQHLQPDPLAWAWLLPAPGDPKLSVQTSTALWGFRIPGSHLAARLAARLKS